jgi:hypothetical protein
VLAPRNNIPYEGRLDLNHDKIIDITDIVMEALVFGNGC